MALKQKVLISREGKKPNQAQGFTEYMQPVIINCANAEDAKNMFGKIVEVEIKSNYGRALEGVLV